MRFRLHDSPFFDPFGDMFDLMDMSSYRRARRPIVIIARDLDDDKKVYRDKRGKITNPVTPKPEEPKNEPKEKNEPQQTIPIEEVKSGDKKLDIKSDLDEKLKRVEELFGLLPNKDTEDIFDLLMKFKGKKEEEPKPEEQPKPKTETKSSGKKVFKVTTKPRQLECIKWDGSEDTFNEIYIWSGRNIQIIQNQLYMFPPLSNDNDDAIIAANIGEYIVKNENGDFFVVKEDRLKEHYDR